MAFSGSQITRLAVFSVPTRKNGSFAGKAATVAVAVTKYEGLLRNVGRFMNTAVFLTVAAKIFGVTTG